MKGEDSRVGIRELRQNLSVYLRRVEAGETLEVTDRGRPVAVLAPLLEQSSVLQRLIAEGHAIPAEGDLMELLPPKGRVSTKASEALQELRADRL